MVNNITIILVQNYCKSKNVNKITNHHFTVTTLLYLYFLWTNMSIYEIHVQENMFQENCAVFSIS